MEWLNLLFAGTPLWMWLMFMGIVTALLVFDLGVLNKDDHEIGVKESLKLSAFTLPWAWRLAAGYGGTAAVMPACSTSPAIWWKNHCRWTTSS
jgi:hypothetical protein